MPHAARPEDFTYLRYVTTLNGAARMTGKHPNTIQYAIDANNIAAWKDGGTWLVSIPSLLRWFPPQIVENPLNQYDLSGLL